MEEDAKNVLKFMASNGLVTNPSKTAFIIINLKNEQEAKEIRIGNSVVQREKSAKLLGMTFQILNGHSTSVPRVEPFQHSTKDFL